MFLFRTNLARSFLDKVIRSVVTANDQNQLHIPPCFGRAYVSEYTPRRSTFIIDGYIGQLTVPE